MVTVENSHLNTDLKVKTSDKEYKALVVEKPFYDPKKKIASAS